MTTDKTFSNMMSWVNVQSRNGPFPLDRYSIFSSFAEASAYATLTGATQLGYEGQVVAVTENGIQKVYVLDSSLSTGLRPVGDTSDILPIIEYLSSEISSNDNDIEYLSGQHDWLSTALSTDIKALSTSLSDTVKLSVENLQNQLTSNDADIEYLSGQHDWLSTALSTDIKALSASLSTTTKLSVEDLQLSVSKLEEKKLNKSDFVALCTEIGLDAATKDNKVVTKQDITDLNGAMHFRDAVEKLDDVKDPKAGDVVIIISTSKEYVYANNQWIELGDEKLYATKQEVKDISVALSNDYVAKVEALNTALSTDLKTEIDSRILADTALEKKIDEKIYVRNQYVNSLSIVNIAQDAYHKLVDDGEVDPNTVYIVSADIYNMYDQKIINLAPGTEEKDAVNFGQLSSLSSTIMSEVEANKLSSITLGDTTFTPENNSFKLDISVISCGGAE